MKGARLTLTAVVTVAVTLLLGTSAASTATSATTKETDKAVLFAADGLRQDLVEKYAQRGDMPTMRQFLSEGRSLPATGS